MKDSGENRVYRLLGVDNDGLGHYWLESDMLHSVVCRVDEDYDVVERMNFITENGVADYVRKHELQGLSELAEDHLA